MNIEEIIQKPTTFEDRFRGECHESLLRSWSILRAVKEMLERGDSAKTILTLIDYIEEHRRSALKQSVIQSNI